MCTEENRKLRRENSELKERLNMIELSQLRNNVIISRMPEQPWESYSTTKECVYDSIASAMGGEDLTETKKEACKIKITCCSRTGTYQLNRLRPTSVTFQCHDDKQKLLESKRNLPKGIYFNEEFPPHIK